MTMWVCGEVLVDLIPDAGNPDSSIRVGVIGGGPENTAKALAVFSGPPPITPTRIEESGLPASGIKSTNTSPQTHIVMRLF